MTIFELMQQSEEFDKAFLSGMSCNRLWLDFYPDKSRSAFQTAYERFRAWKQQGGVSLSTYHGKSSENGTQGQETVSQEEHQHKGNEWKVTTKGNRVKTLEDLIAVCEVDLTLWQVADWTANKWEVGAKDPVTGEIRVEPLYQVKARFVKKVHASAMRDEVDKFLKEIRDNSPKFPVIYRTPSVSEENLIEIAAPDFHLGKVAFPDGSYDPDTAKGIFFDALENLLRRSRAYNPNRIVFPIGNDFLNADAFVQATTAGTPQKCDGHQEHLFRHARRILVEAVEWMLDIADVDIIPVPGNHDYQSTFYLSEVLDSYFHRCPNVRIDQDISPSKYYEWGKCMFLYTHGDKENPASLCTKAATEQPEMWGRTKFREAHVGHKHTRKLVQEGIGEHMGFQVRFFPALCPADRWHHERAFVGNRRSAEALVWNKEEGLISTHIYNAK